MPQLNLPLLHYAQVVLLQMAILVSLTADTPLSLAAAATSSLEKLAITPAGLESAHATQSKSVSSTSQASPTLCKHLEWKLDSLALITLSRTDMHSRLLVMI